MENVHIGGDAYRGPATVVESIADARRAVASIMKKEMIGHAEPGSRGHAHDRSRFKDIYEKKGKLLPALISRDDKKVARNEYQRCLECDSVCNKCVDVCPNRANLCLSVDEKHGFRDAWQILHLDALCNECGNCGTFCPYAGLPYKDKLTLFDSKADFDASSNNGFCVSKTSNRLLAHLRLHGAVIQKELPAKDSENQEMKKVLAVVDTVIEDYPYLLNISPREARCFF